jgi:hypothetical protein
LFFFRKDIIRKESILQTYLSEQSQRNSPFQIKGAGSLLILKGEFLCDCSSCECFVKKTFGLLLEKEKKTFRRGRIVGRRLVFAPFGGRGCLGA